jgi:predicted AlkP superfamily phosphohydrolase/phosphomutase
MDGGICVNEYLLREHWLALAQDRPAQPTPLEKVKVDWGKTRAWGEGGYYARVFLNVAGREPQGTIAPADYERVRDELAEKLRSIRGPQGEDIGTRVFKPQEIYQQVNGIAPDLLVYFGDLYWRSVGSLGHPQVWTRDNDTGPDEANHAQHGIFIYHDPRRQQAGRELTGLQIMDIAPTVLQRFGLAIPPAIQGRAIRFEA